MTKTVIADARFLNTQSIAIDSHLTNGVHPPITPCGVVIMGSPPVNADVSFDNVLHCEPIEDVDPVGGFLKGEPILLMAGVSGCGKSLFLEMEATKIRTMDVENIKL